MINDKSDHWVCESTVCLLYKEGGGEGNVQRTARALLRAVLPHVSTQSAYTKDLLWEVESQLEQSATAHSEIEVVVRREQPNNKEPVLEKNTCVGNNYLSCATIYDGGGDEKQLMYL